MTRTILFAIAISTVALAQEPADGNASFRGMVRLNRAPVSNDVLKVKLPRPVERKLSNGLQLLVLESHRGPIVTLTITIPSSHLRDPEGLPGVAEATAAVMQLGTPARTARRLADDLSAIGATLSISVGGGGGGGRGRPGFGGASNPDAGTISLSALSENFDAALAILTDVLLNPAFPADEFEKWKTRQRAALEQARTSPNVLANEQLMSRLYPSDARHARVTEESLAKITRENLVQHYKAYYRPSGNWAGIAGEFTPKEAVAKLEKALGEWKGAAVEPLKLAIEPPLADKKVVLVSRPNSVQTYLVVANRAIDRLNPDYIPCMVMNQVLGSGPASRLFRIIREEKGYTYGVSSSFTASRYLQTFSAAMSVRTDVTGPALTDLLKEFKEIRESAIPKDEFDGAKRALVASFALGLENPSMVLARWLQQREFGLPEDYWDTYTAKIMAVTPGDVSRVAGKYVPYDNAQVIAVGDGAKIRDLLKAFGPLEEIQAAQN